VEIDLALGRDAFSIVASVVAIATVELLMMMKMMYPMQLMQRLGSVVELRMKMKMIGARVRGCGRVRGRDYMMNDYGAVDVDDSMINLMPSLRCSTLNDCCSRRQVLSMKPLLLDCAVDYAGCYVDDDSKCNAVGVQSLRSLKKNCCYYYYYYYCC